MSELTNEQKERVILLRARMADILGISPLNGIENSYEHAIQYQLDDNEKDRFQELREDLKKADSLTVTKIRVEMAKILGQDTENQLAELNVENLNEHAIPYQLDDNEIDEFQELRQELTKIMSAVEKPKEPTSVHKKDAPKQKPVVEDKSKVKPSEPKQSEPAGDTPPKASDGDLGAKSQNSTGEIARLERAIKMLNQQIANANEALKEPKKTPEELAKIEEMIKGYEKDKERCEKQIEDLKKKDDKGKPPVYTPQKASGDSSEVTSQNNTEEIVKLKRVITFLDKKIVAAKKTLNDPQKKPEELAKIKGLIKQWEEEKKKCEKQIEELKAKAKNEKPSEGKSTGEDTVREGWLLRFVRWCRARWASFLDWCETKLISSKKALPDASKKKTKKKKEITKKKTKTAEKNEPTAENEQRKKDILWIKEKCETTHARATILDTMAAAAYQKATSGNNSGKSLSEEYFKVILEKEGRPKVLSSSKENLYYEYTRDKILERAQKEGIQTEEKDGTARSIEDVYSELEEKIKLREKTDAVSGKAAGQIANGNPKEQPPKIGKEPAEK